MTRIAAHTRARARELRKDMTPQERRLWTKLREVNRMLGTHFRRQAPVGHYIADFADLGRRLVLEVDGGGHGGGRDQARDAWFAAQGFRVLRFWNSDVAGNMEGVMQVLLDALDAAPPPRPSPTRGEGVARAADRAPEGNAPTSRSCRTVGVEASPPPCGEGPWVGGARPEGQEP